MKKIIVFVICLFVPMLLSPYVCSIDENEIKSRVEQSFFGSLDGEIYNELEQNGLGCIDPDNIFSAGTESIKKFFSNTFAEKLKSAASWFFLMLCVLMLLSVLSSAFDFSASADVFSFLSAVVLSLCTFSKISSFLGCAVSAVELNSKLMGSFVPVFTLLISLSGNPTGALTYNSAVMFFCELMTFFISKVFLSLIGMYFALSVSFSFNSSINLNRFTNSVNRAVNLVLGFSASSFTAILSVKNILAYSADSLSVRGARFLLGSLVPVIGSSLSQAYSSVLASINLMKSSLGVLGIFALIILNIPAVTEGIIYYLMLCMLSFFAEVMGLYRASECLKSFSGCIKILLLVCVFQLFILIISVGIMLTLKGGV